MDRPAVSDAQRLAFAAYLTAVLGEVGSESEEQRAPNRTQLHKAGFLLESVAGVPHGFPYALHLHGPYSRELDMAVSELKAIGWLHAEREATGFGARYTVTDHARRALPRYLDGWRRYESAIRAVGREVLPRTVSELELLSTALYVDQKLPGVDEARRVARLKEIKPYFSEEQIRAGFLAARELAGRVRTAC